MKGHRILLSCAGLCALFVWLSAPFAQAVRYVSLTGSNTPPYDTWATAATNIQIAVDAASAGENIIVTNGTYSCTNEIRVSQGLYIHSVNGASVTIVDGLGAHRVFHLSSFGTTLTLEGFSIVHGAGLNQGSGVWIQQSVIVQDCILRGNTNSGMGGGVYLAMSGVVQRCLIEGNNASSLRGGGVYASGGLVQDCTIRGNRAHDDGGGVYMESSGAVRNCLIVSNTAEGGYGGGVWCEAGALENCTVVGNRGAGQGGGVYAGSADSVIRNCLVHENTSATESNWSGSASAVWEHCATLPSNGTACVTADPQLWNWPAGDVRLRKGSPCIDSGTNRAWMSGAPDYLGHPRVCNNTVDIGADEFSAAFVSLSGGNTPPYDTWAKAATNVWSAVLVASNGCAVLITNGEYALTAITWVSNSIEIAGVNGADATFINGRGTYQGFRLLTNAVVEDLAITNCFAQGGLNSGGAVYCRGGVVRDCVLAGNGAMAAGGAAYVDATGAVEDCEIVDNSAFTDSGGGAYLDGGGIVRRCTIRSNSGNTGGGLCLTGGGEVRSCLVLDNRTANGGGGAILYGGGLVDSCTIYSNSASHGGGTECSGGGQIRNSIVWSNAAAVGPNYNNVSGGSWTNCCTTPATGALCIATDPAFRNAGAYDFRLATNSPCIDSGTNQAWMADGTDVSGYPRIQNAVVDRGAYERSPTHYVSPLGAHVWPFVTWSNAATNVQSAVDAAEEEDSILVTNGVFTGAAAISVTQALSIASVNGAAVTAIDGGGMHRCFSVTTNAVIDGLTITNGHSTDSAGGVFCTGGAIFQNCVIRDCTATNYGAGVYVSASGTVRNCTITCNVAGTNDGGGLCLSGGGLVDRCLILSNSAYSAGGLFMAGGGAVRNSLIAGNRARGWSGGGVFLQAGGVYAIDSCTIAGNSAKSMGGGLFVASGGSISNSVVYENTTDTPVASSNWANGAWSYSCAAPAPGGTGNAGGNPRFADTTAGNFRVGSNSPCYNAGTNAAWMAGATDLDGFSRVINGSVDMGCYEVTPVHCVAASGTPAWPYDSWTNAATNLQTAINVAQPDDAILVSNGTYIVGSFVWASQRVAIVGVNGRDVTAIDGGGATRCLYMPNGGVLSGLTFTNANWPGDGGGVYAGGGVLIHSCRVVNCAAEWSGGGIYLNSSGVVQYCDVRQNRAGQMGGGVMLYLGGLLQNSTVFSNRSAGSGGGVFNGNGGNVRNCLVEANAATNANGGGIYIDTSGWVENDTLVRNVASGSGGGAYCLGGGTIRNSILVSNAAAAGANWATNGGGQFAFTCSTPLPPGVGNTSNDPKFISFASRNYQPFFDSPCRDTATNLPWMSGATDLAGVPRICGLAPDLGAQELPVRLVSKTGSQTAPFLTWPTSATNLQTAADYAGYGGAVLVSNGNYTFASEVSVTARMEIASVNGAGSTFFNGGSAHRIFYIAAAARIRGFRFFGGYTAGDGGGVYAMSGAGACIQDCAFEACVAGGGGGGLYVGRTGVVERCTIYRCATPSSGGGAYLDGGGILMNCLVQSNTARDGGGVYLLTGGVVRSSLILQNTASNTAGGARLELGSPRLENCTVAGNSSAVIAGGAMVNSGGFILNSIVYGNASATDSNVTLSGSGGLTNCCTAPSLGSACVSAAPQFVDSARGLYSLAWDSPCVDAGTNAAWMADALDLAGDTRLFGARVDLGAYELHRMYVAAAGGSTFPYDTWAKAATDIQTALDAASNYYEVRVTNGTYAPGAELVVSREAALRGANGAGVTIVNAGGSHRGVNLGPYARLDGFTISNASASAVGAGVYCDVGSLVQNCVITGNRSTTNGAGVYLMPTSVVQFCTIAGNSNSACGGGAAMTRTGLLLSCIVRSNSAATAGGGVYCDGGGSVRNCLVANNVSSMSDGAGGGVYLMSGLPGCYAENCTVLSNAAWAAGGVFVNGGGEVWNCIVYGNLATTGSNYWDVGFGSWTNNCTLPAIGIGAVTNAPQYVNVAAGNFRQGPASPCINAGAAEPWMADASDLDGATRVNGAGVDIGAYEFHYNCVSLSGGNVVPYDTWAKAATSIQPAVDLSTNGYSVLVTNGVYTLASEILVTQSVRIASVNGADVTTVHGAGAYRCFDVTTNALVTGFTLTNGYSSSQGGGANLDHGAVMATCRIVNCTAAYFGGGAFATRNSEVRDCTFLHNRVTTGGSMGGGIYVTEGALVDRCVLNENQAYGTGGGGLCDQGGTTRNCLIIHNVSAGGGGGAYLRSGGLPGTLESSTICSNAAGDSGGVFFDGVGTLRNCIVYYNSSSNYGGSGATVLFCNTTPSTGVACVTADPAFVGAGDYHPSFLSPCLNAGTNLAWMSAALDLDLGPRLVGAGVDLGAYELGTIHYVKLSGSPVSPFTTWANAATNIQAAVNVCAEGDAVLVTNGSYSSASEIVVTQRVTIMSVNGRDATSVNGGKSHRGFRIQTNAILDGLAVTNGYSGDVGGGVLLSGGGLIRNCLIQTNVAATYGGGVFVQVTGVVERCSMIGNVAVANDGGGVYLEPGGVVLDSVVTSNRARHGGGVYSYYGGLIRNSLLADNIGRSWGGGVHFYMPGGVADSCTIVGNSADYGGGTFTMQGGSFQNCIIYFNTAASDGDNNYDDSDGQWANCCTVPSIGTDCITADPMFANRAAGDFRLAWGSPCLDSALVEAWMDDGRDLDNDLRIWNDEADIGAYELPIIHVATNGGSVTPYATWGDAATNPVDAAAVARGHCAIWVADGTYPISAQISLTGSVTFVSASGAGATTIRGSGSTRCFDIGYGSCVIDGFTIERGVTNLGRGGAVYITRGGTIQNCIIRSNTAVMGGGVFCYASGMVDRCVLTANRATNSAGGAAYLLAGGLVQNCLVYSNTAAAGGGGICIDYGTGMVRNCTIVRNVADDGGGIYCGPESRVENTIAWFNTAASGSNHYESGLNIAYTNCCTAPALGTGCVSNDPLFADLAACNFRIGTNSPCVDAGADVAVVTNDFDGMMRPLDGNRDGTAKWDIGAYEAMNILADTDHNGLPDGWEDQYYGAPVSGANPAVDEDGDTVTNRDEAIADTDPHSSSSFLAVTNVFLDGDWRTIQFWSSANRIYTQQVSTNPADASSWRSGSYVDQRGTGGTRSWKETNAPFVVDRVLVEMPP